MQKDEEGGREAKGKFAVEGPSFDLQLITSSWVRRVHHAQKIALRASCEEDFTSWSELPSLGRLDLSLFPLALLDDRHSVAIKLLRRSACHLFSSALEHPKRLPLIKSLATFSTRLRRSLAPIYVLRLVYSGLLPWKALVRSLRSFSFSRGAGLGLTK